MKQIGLGLMQYVQDYDEFYPHAQRHVDWGFAWPLALQPYMKSTQVFMCPSDPDAGKPSPDASGWAGVKISYAANSYVGSIPPLWEWQCLGLIMPDGTPGGDIGFSSGMPLQRSLSSVTLPAETIAVAEKHSADVTKLGGTYAQYGVASAFGYGSSLTNAMNWADDGYNIPVGTRAGTAYNTGTAGGVSVRHLETSNYLFADGHVKALKASATNPDGATSQWDSSTSSNIVNKKNMWIAIGR